MEYFPLNRTNDGVLKKKKTTIRFVWMERPHPTRGGGGGGNDKKLEEKLNWKTWLVRYVNVVAFEWGRTSSMSVLHRLLRLTLQTKNPN